jgi:glycosyltransferase involved in cell wall biosynthesis
MYREKRVSVVFPAYNEEENIKTAIEDFFKCSFVDEIVVVDNNSKDRTKEEIKKTEAKYIFENKQGYGNALQRGLREATGDYIITSEPDGTFVGKDVEKLLIYSWDADAVFGTRTYKGMIGVGANMGWFLRLGNVFVAKLMEYMFKGPCLTDVGCTMKLIKRNVLEKIQDKFTIGTSHFSPEFMVLCLKNNIRTVEVPLNYGTRIGTSKITGTFWNSFKLGWIMIGLLFSYKLGFKKS